MLLNSINLKKKIQGSQNNFVDFKSADCKVFSLALEVLREGLTFHSLVAHEKHKA